MISILKKPDEYILNDNQFKLASKSLYGYESESLLVKGELDSSEKYNKPSVTFNTILGQFHFPKNLIITAKSHLDFSNDVQTRYKASLLVPNDFLLIPYPSYTDDVKNSFRVTSYLHMNKYDFSYIDPDLISKINVPEWFLLKYLLTGVPDHERYNNLVDIYLMENRLSVDEFKTLLLNKYGNPIRREIRITKGFVALSLIKLSGYYFAENNLIKLNLKDFNQNLIFYALEFLTDHNIKFDMNENKLIIKSSFIYNLFSKDFGEYRFANTLSPMLKAFFIKGLKEFKNVVGTEISLMYIQNFLIKEALTLSSISAFNETHSILTLLKNTEDYIRVPDGFLLPILSVEETEFSSLLQLNIRETNDY